MAERALTVADRLPQVGDVLEGRVFLMRIIGTMKRGYIFSTAGHGVRGLIGSAALQDGGYRFWSRSDRGPVTITESDVAPSGPEPGAGGEC